MSLKRKFLYDDKSELFGLQKENLNLRNQLKDLGSKINTLISLRDTQKTKRTIVISNPKEELKEAGKIIEIYKKEKSFLFKRVKKAMNSDYLNNLVKQVDKFHQALAESENSRKVAEYYERKEIRYRPGPSKTPVISMELDVLNSKRQNYIEKIQQIEESLVKNKKMLNEINNRFDELEKDHKKLMSDLGDSYFKEKSIKQIMVVINKKEKIRNLIEKGANSKNISMMQKIKLLQSELKILKDNENEVNNLYVETVRKADKYKECIISLQYSHNNSYYY
ncbi:hypothetical protein SteCoe_18582 [Stentor coeruleus]|uniref:DUF4201 domain-containing protein n=1 Tax=Stentor coeruleus TaxID=5963 RepID=A0A1R2BWE4_9CILI|nr:hypothetical protein SteCoe_18582 [Stentor coeruleus]